MEALQEKLYALVSAGPVTTVDAAQKMGVEIQSVTAAMKSLEAMEVVVSQLEKKAGLRLTADGQSACERGSPEFQVWRFLAGRSMQKQELVNLFGEDFMQIALAGGLRRKILTLQSVEKKDPNPLVVPAHVEDRDEVQEQLRAFETQPAQIQAGLKKSKYLEAYEEKFFLISRGPRFDAGLAKAQTELTQADVLAKRQVVMKPLNFEALGKPPASGALHPLLKMRASFIEVLTAMGFAQMQTEKYVESSFWNFDSLIQPQQHPARDMHDTFFVKGAAQTADLTKVDPAYLQGIKQMHQTGGFGSRGYNYVWSEAEASKNILRTHTTAETARTLYAHAQKCLKNGQFTPLKCFSIDKVFRNETLDATHLCEFNQVEGFVIDKNLNLGNLMAVIRSFFTALGMPQIRFKPCYNPYTEPSMEIFCFHTGLKRWIEVGNSGIFRPEMLRPMGLPEDAVAIAWGLSLERPTMIKYGINNIRDLVGPACDLTMIQTCNDPLLE